MSPLKHIRVQASVVVGSQRLRLRELLRLERGSVITLAADAASPSALHVNGVPVANGEILLDQGRTAFEVAELVPRA